MSTKQLRPGKRMVAVVVAVFVLLSASVASAQSSDDSTRIHLIHGVPGVDVDVDVAGAPLISAFAFGQTRDLSPNAGDTLESVMLRASETGELLADVGDVRLPTSGSHSVLAHLSADGQPILTIFENDRTPLPVGRGGIVIRHGAAGPPVDVLLDGLVAFEDVANGESRRAELPEFTLALSLETSGTDESPIFGPADITIVEGETVVVYAVGSVADGLGVVSETIVGVNGAPTRINTGLSPLDAPLDQTVFVFVMMGLVALVGVRFSGRGIRTILS